MDIKDEYINGIAQARADERRKQLKETFDPDVIYFTLEDISEEYDIPYHKVLRDYKKHRIMGVMYYSGRGRRFLVHPNEAKKYASTVTDS